MSDEAKFNAFKRGVINWHEETYGKEARKRYGDAQVDEAQAAVLRLTPEQYEAWTALSREIQQRLEAAVQAGRAFNGDEGVRSSPCTAAFSPSAAAHTTRPSTGGSRNSIRRTSVLRRTMTKTCPAAPAFCGMRCCTG